MKVEILADSVGERLVEETAIRPKPFVEIRGRGTRSHAAYISIPDLFEG